MSQKGDSSQFSGLSGVSIIRSSSSQEQPPDGIKNAPRKSNLDTETIVSCTADCEETFGENLNLHLIHESLESVINNEDLQLSPEIAIKLRQIILAHNVDKYLRNAIDVGDHIHTSLLGITDVPRPEFTIDEKKLVRAAVEREIQARDKRFTAKFETLGGNLRETMESNKSSARMRLSKINETSLSNWKEKLGEVCNEYQRDVLKLSELLDEWKKLKYEDVEEINVKRGKTKLFQSQIAEVQAKITKISSNIKMFNETPRTIDAFKIVSEILNEKVAKVEVEIKKKKLLKKQYEDLQGTEYDDILKRYLDLCTTIKKEERLLEML